jgi:NADH:ubiquinone oxidoreductase subunit E
LIETLHTIPQSFGYLDEVALRFVARSLHVARVKFTGSPLSTTSLG